jgi:nicotinate-nucleotide adenylyltransferase
MRLRKTPSEITYAFKAGTEHPVSQGSVERPRVGIYAGSFDPVHAGHIVFALKAQKLAGLERVYFMPERRPRFQTEPEHYVHRAVMLKRALKPHAQFSLLDLPDAHLSLRSIPRVREDLPKDAELSLLTTASELLWHPSELPALYEQVHLIVAITSHSQLAEVMERLNASEKHFHNLTFVDIGKDHVSSSAVRSGLRRGEPVRGLLPSVLRYARQQWLYIAPHKS